MMEDKHREVNDIETLFSVFTSTFINYDTGEVRVFEISRRKNELPQLREFFKTIRYLVGFNSVAFDNPVQGWLLNQRFDTDNGEYIAHEIYKVAQILITRSDDFDAIREYLKYGKFEHIQVIDLFTYWSKMLRMSKKLSLKFFAVNLGMNVQEMPIHHSQQYLTDEEIDQVIEYNKNDIFVTKRLAEELREQINLRVWIQQTYGIKCLSMDAPKIAAEILLKSYCEATGADPYEIKKRRYIRPVIHLKDVVPKVTFKTPFFQKIYQDIQNAVDSFKGEYLYKNPDGEYLKLSYGTGGLHSINSNQVYVTTSNQKVVTSDVGSLYPALIINNGYVSPELGVQLLEVYKSIREQRLEAKRNKDKTKDTLLKLVLNSTSGLIDNPHHWLYAPEQALSLRLHGQLLLSRLVEECGLHGISVVSLNTDGAEIILNPFQQSVYDEILKTIEQEFNVQFESDTYQFIKYKTVNDYIALTESGKVKCKGEFVYEKVLDGSNEFLIVPLALKEYYVNNVPIEKTIRECTDLQFFCTAKKIDKKYEVYCNNEKQQQLNRYFVSTVGKGFYLYKQKEGKKTMECVLKNTPIVIVNESLDKPAQSYPINYNWYIQKCRETIEQLEPKQLDLFSQSLFTNAA